jgi:hypothetical protein
LPPDAAVYSEVMTLHRDAAPSIHRVVDAYTNWYLVEARAA